MDTMAIWGGESLNNENPMFYVIRLQIRQIAKSGELRNESSQETPDPTSVESVGRARDRDSVVPRWSMIMVATSRGCFLCHRADDWTWGVVRRRDSKKWNDAIQTRRTRVTRGLHNSTIVTLGIATTVRRLRRSPGLRKSRSQFRWFSVAPFANVYPSRGFLFYLFIFLIIYTVQLCRIYLYGVCNLTSYFRGFFFIVLVIIAWRVPGVPAFLDSAGCFVTRIYEFIRGRTSVPRRCAWWV